LTLLLLKLSALRLGALNAREVNMVLREFGVSN
jgi:hypothetical protein